MGFFSKIKNKLETFIYGLVGGMKITEDQILKQSGTVSDGNVSVVKQVEDNRISKAMLRGEVTQEVSELRYRTYLVDKESKKYKYYAPTLALKKKPKTEIKFPYYKDDELTLITSQLNDEISSEKYNEYLDIVGNLKEAEEEGINERQKNEILQYYKTHTCYRIDIERSKDFTPRYKIEEYVKRIDVKHMDETHAVFELYVTKYMNSEDFKSKGFIREIEKIKDNDLRSDIISFKKLSFVTKNAFNIEDSIKFEFSHIHLINIVEVDGSYVLRFMGKYEQNEIDYTKIYYSKSMDMKYKENVPKELNVNMGDFLVDKTYVCEECGKEIVYDIELMDKLKKYDGRDITEIEEKEEDSSDVTEFLDMQISKETFGKCLCTDCLRKYMKENNLI